MKKCSFVVYFTLSITTIIFLFGVGVWLLDGAWVNGALPTHGLYHMFNGFIGAWFFYALYFYLKNKKT